VVVEVQLTSSKLYLNGH